MDAFTQLQQLSPLYVQLFFVGFSLLIVVLELPLALNRIEPNRIYGFRVRKTLSDERIWYAANEYAGKGAILIAVITIVLALVVRLAGASVIASGVTLAVVFFGGLLLTILKTLMYIQRIS